MRFSFHFSLTGIYFKDLLAHKWIKVSSSKIIECFTNKVWLFISVLSFKSAAKSLKSTNQVQRKKLGKKKLSINNESAKV